MSDQLVGGLLQLQVNGEIYNAKGNFTYNLGKPKKEAVIGADRVHGWKGVPQVPFIEGAITDNENIDLETLVTMKDATVSLRLANGKSIMLREACYAHEGTGSTEEGEFPVRFEGKSAVEVK